MLLRTRARALGAGRSCWSGPRASGGRATSWRFGPGSDAGPRGLARAWFERPGPGLRNWPLAAGSCLDIFLQILEDSHGRPETGDNKKGPNDFPLWSGG